MNRNVLITGAGRGLGLEMTRQLLTEGDSVVACPRVPGSPGLDELTKAHPERLRVVPMNVADDDSIAEAFASIAPRIDHLDVLVNNAGLSHRGEGSVEVLDTERLVDAFRVNAVAPLRVVAAFLPLLRAGTGRRILCVSSLMGSIADNASGGSYGYRMSKAALNMAVRNLANELGSEGFVVLALHPGWVRTRMGGEEAPLGIAEAVAETLRIGLGTGAERSGMLLGSGGATLPW